MEGAGGWGGGDAATPAATTTPPCARARARARARSLSLSHALPFAGDPPAPPPSLARDAGRILTPLVPTPSLRYRGFSEQLRALDCCQCFTCFGLCPNSEDDEGFLGKCISRLYGPSVASSVVSYTRAQMQRNSNSTVRRLVLNPRSPHNREFEGLQ